MVKSVAESLKLLNADIYKQRVDVYLQTEGWSPKDRNDFKRLHAAYEKIAAEDDSIFVSLNSLLKELNRDGRKKITEQRLLSKIIHLMNECGDGSESVVGYETPREEEVQIRLGLRISELNTGSDSS